MDIKHQPHFFHKSFMAILSLLLMFLVNVASPEAAASMVTQPPIGVNDTGLGFFTYQDRAFITANVLANDSDPADNPLFISGFDTSQTRGKVEYLIPGSLDYTFGDNGKVITNAGGYTEGAAIALQSDGKMVVVGSFQGRNLTIARFLPDGSLDPSFGQNGFVIANMIPALGQSKVDRVSRAERALPQVVEYEIETNGLAIAIQPNGKILVTGMLIHANNGLPEIFVARYDSTGVLDPTFNGIGFVATAIGSDDRGFAIALQPDGKILVSGASDGNFALLRYLSNGTLDPSFNGKGWITTDFGGYDRGWAVALQKDGKIVVAGYSFPDPNSNYCVIALARYNANGSIDASFDGNGKETVGFGYGAFGYALALQSDQKIIVAGSYSDGTKNNFALVRFAPDGSLDPGFNGDGKVLANFHDSFGQAVIQQIDGKILIAGDGSNGSANGFALARYNLDGSLDTSFNHGEIVITPFGLKPWGRSLALLPNGRIIVAGTVDTNQTLSIGIVRYNGDGTFSYDPNNQFNGLLPGQQATDTFAYTVSDGVLTNTATVTITINGIERTFFPMIAK